MPLDGEEESRSSRHPSPWIITRDPHSATDGGTLEFGRFQLLLRRRELLADGVPIKLGTRAVELLLALLEADGSLVTKDQLLCRVWSDLTVAEVNLKVQICALRNALGNDRDLIRTEFGRGYRFVGTFRTPDRGRAPRRSARRCQRHQPIRRLPVRHILDRGATQRDAY
jgi:DNA-binding winged helix-turn-helix (wHTH) protein